MAHQCFCSAAARYPRFLGQHFGIHGFYLKGISEHYNAHNDDSAGRIMSSEHEYREEACSHASAEESSGVWPAAASTYIGGHEESASPPALSRRTRSEFDLARGIFAGYAHLLGTIRSIIFRGGWPTLPASLLVVGRLGGHEELERSGVSG